MKTILVIDDEFDISEALSAVLQAEGFKVEVRNDGREALAYFAGLGDNTTIPAAIFLDVMMPFVSGFEVLRYVRSQRLLKDIPVVLMSAAVPNPGQTDLGWTEFLRKPFNLPTLLKVVEKHVGKV